MIWRLLCAIGIHRADELLEEWAEIEEDETVFYRTRWRCHCGETWTDCV